MYLYDIYIEDDDDGSDKRQCRLEIENKARPIQHHRVAQNGARAAALL